MDLRHPRKERQQQDGVNINVKVITGTIESF